MERLLDLNIFYKEFYTERLGTWWDDKFTMNPVVAFSPAAPNGDGYALRNKLNYLHRGFPKRDAISPKEFAHILKRYA